MKIYPIVDLLGAPLLMAEGLALAAMERARPLRARLADRRLRRLLINGGFVLGAFAITRFAVIPAMVGASRRARRARFGLLRRLPLPRPARAALALLLLDYAMYLWHRMNHQIPVLWRFHRVHHTDLDLDITTAFRFHAGEIAASIAFRTAQVAVVGAGPRTALLYEVLMQCATAFHHANIRLPEGLERALSRIFVTPRMHTVHHSVKQEEVHSNWSVVFSLWDRIHGTFSPPFPERPVTLGVPEHRDPAELTLPRLFGMPFRRRQRSAAAP